MMSTWSRLFFCAGSLSAAATRSLLDRIVIDQIGDPEDTASGRLDELEAARRIGSLPLAQFLDDVLDLLDLVLGALPRIDVRDVNDRLLVRIEHFQHVVGITPCVEEIADVEPLQMLVAVELLVVGVGNGFELHLVIGYQHGLGIPTEVRPRHRHDMRLVACNELAEM